MSDTKGINNLRDSLQGQVEALNGRLDTVERARFELEQELNTVRQELGKTRSENTRLRSECRRLDDRFARVGIELRNQLSTCKAEAENNPGGGSFAGRVRQATEAMRIYDAIAEGGDRA
jgi:uncharacterized protein (DUF3084 family)